ncbi:helicase C-terminal domain-containing protein [Phascolomyces articulosus]|uniref:ATP-dependent DNA helicase CHL1 n=1 Tax=Phascolomyces articulosus TaxID=60185 RepID=A0AAD5JSE9_9FUNG|nr:helicase C-terminal domain-containing protein [Phascolomyces articulosus]
MVDRDYGFPFQPYSIQNEFMNSLYDTLSKGKIGIFESPTGTGKSLSIICGSLRWLKDHDDNGMESNNTKKSDTKEDEDDEPDWVKAFQVTNKAEQQREILRKEKRNDLRKRIQRARQLEESRASFTFGESDPSLRWKKRQKMDNAKKEKKKKDDDDEFLLDEYVSDDENNDKEPTSSNDSNSNLSKEVRELLAKLEPTKSALSNAQEQDDEEDEDNFDQLKIYYTSRTHSQLSQFIHEVHKTMYSPDTWTIPLGSRKNTCIHKDVKKLKSVQRMNEACLELQKKTSTSATKCPYLPSKTERSQWNTFRDHALAKVRDIEDLVQVGEQMGICPYYGSRYALRPAQLVVLPYQHLLHASTRDSLGISLKNSVVIIDEAHNLIETITTIHTITMTLQQTRMAFSQLVQYVQRYKNRLHVKNMAYIRQILSIVKALIKLLEPGDDNDSKNKKDCVMGVNEFVHLLGIDHINMFKIEKYLKASHLARKLNGFIDKEELKKQSSISDQQQKNSSTTMPTLTIIESFLLTLTNPDKDGRIVINYSENNQPQVKYMLLNPAEVFQPIVDDAKSIILAGGTMEPITDFVNILLHHVAPSQIDRLSCGHIIPPSNMAVMSIDTGPTGKSFLFRYDNRQDEKLMDEVGQAIVNLCNIIPDGVVCFFSSFTYLDQLYKRWSQYPQNGTTILSRLEKKKKVFKEPRESNQVENTLRDYAMHIDQSGGALLLCVVNGKMSEGINFSDQLGRGVIMIGLPFANRSSVELQEKIKYASEMNPGQSDAGNEYYENLCMRGVNQSIGRAIRHRNDYATIILLDQRYSQPRIRNKLPGWIGNHVEHCDKFGMAMGNTVRFFKQFR